MSQARNGQFLVSPSRNLPTEIVAEILECCSPTNSERLESPLHRLAPLVLTWVCQAWRNLCLSLPTLWTELAIGHRGTDPEEDARVLELWTSRTGYLPISLKLTYEIDDSLNPVLSNQEKEKKYRRSMQRLLQVAVTCVERWSSFEIHTLNISVLDQIFLAIVTRGSPCLKHLSLSTKYLGFFGDTYVLDFSLCPSLQSIYLRSPMISPVIGSDPMKNMTRLELRFCSSFEDCLRWIDICPSLEELTIRLFCSDINTLRDNLGQQPLHNPHHLPRLKYLELHGFSIAVDIGPLLDILDVPALTSLAINMYDMINSSRRWTHVSDLVRRLEPPLEILQLYGTPMTTEDIVECLHIAPVLKKLSLGTRHDTDILLKSLSIPQNPGPSNKQDSGSIPPSRCPSLKYLDLVNCSTWSITLLASMVSSRCSSHEPPNSEFSPHGQSVAFLEELHLNSDGARHAKENPVIMQSIKQGLRVIESNTIHLVSAFTNPDVVFV